MTSVEEHPFRAFLSSLSRAFRILAIKTYRVDLGDLPHPIIPCLDHEAELHAGAPVHVSAYVEDASHHLHEVSYWPAPRRLWIDGVSTLTETTPDERAALIPELTRLFPDLHIAITHPRALKGDARVAHVVAAQVSLRDVLMGDDVGAVRWQLARLEAIAELMEKNSRVSSWGVRTVTPPLLTGAGVAAYVAAGLLAPWLTPGALDALRYTLLTLLGGALVYLGMKAVQLTEMGTNVWKRATEYRLILDARARLSPSTTERPDAHPPKG